MLKLLQITTLNTQHNFFDDKWLYFCNFPSMLKLFFIIAFCISVNVFSQKKVEATFVNSTDVALQTLVSIDNFGTIYMIDANTFYKIVKDKKTTYSNVQLGNITTANVFNPLKINLFYKNFNTAIILDNRLAEIHKIDFNTIQPYKNVSHISTGYDNTIWIFNTDLQQLELFDYKTNRTRVTALPVQSSVLAMASNYNDCWLLTEKYLYQYNYFGSLIKKLENDGFTELAEFNGNLIIKQAEKLLFLPKDSDEAMPIPINELLIKQFSVTNETLYIYDSEKLQQYQLKFE